MKFGLFEGNMKCFSDPEAFIKTEWTSCPIELPLLPLERRNSILALLKSFYLIGVAIYYSSYIYSNLGALFKNVEGK